FSIEYYTEHNRSLCPVNARDLGVFSLLLVNDFRPQCRHHWLDSRLRLDRLSCDRRALQSRELLLLGRFSWDHKKQVLGKFISIRLMPRISREFAGARFVGQ